MAQLLLTYAYSYVTTTQIKIQLRINTEHLLTLP